MSNSEHKFNSVDEIIEKIRIEAKSKTKKEKVEVYYDLEDIEFEYEDNSSSTDNLKESNFYKLAKNIGVYFRKLGLDNFVKFVKLNLNLQKYRFHHEMEDLTKYYDEEFICNAYKVVLNREIDPQGKDKYLDKLRKGVLSKQQIIAILNFSKEGQQQNININGSRKEYILLKIFKIPVIGYFLKRINYFFTLPDLIQQTNQNENSLII